MLSRWSRSGTGIEHQPELADLDLVAGLEDDFVDPHPVDVGAVQGADITNEEVVTHETEGCVLAGHGDVVEEDVAVGVASRADLVRVKQEPAAAVGTSAYEQQR